MVKMSLRVILSLFLSLYIPCYLAVAPQPSSVFALTPAETLGGICSNLTSGAYLFPFLSALKDHFNPNASAPVVPFNQLCGDYQRHTAGGTGGAVDGVINTVTQNPDGSLSYYYGTGFNSVVVRKLTGYNSPSTIVDSTFNVPHHTTVKFGVLIFSDIPPDILLNYTIPCDLLPPNTMLPGDFFAGGSPIPDGYYTDGTGVTIKVLGGNLTDLGNIGLKPGYAPPAPPDTPPPGGGNSAPPPVASTPPQPSTPTNGSTSMVMTQMAITNLSTLLSAKFDFKISNFSIWSWLPFGRATFPTVFDYVIPTGIHNHVIAIPLSDWMNGKFAYFTAIFRSLLLVGLIYYIYTRLKFFLLSGGS